jgi:chemotaxis protein MotA
MDLATVGGLVVAFGLLLAAILMGGPIILFIDAPSVAIVCGGTIACIFIGFPGGNIKTALGAAKNAFTTTQSDVSDTLRLLSELSNRARREGLLSLEAAAEEASDDFLKRGLRMVVDGHEADAVEDVMYSELEKIEERHKASIRVWEAVGAYSPAMGMIGTLIGLVQMLQNMADPTAIGPAMAVALLTTFYGSVIANLIGIPIANKLKIRSQQEQAGKALVAQGLLSILAGENPRFMVERLNASLAPADRLEDAA